MSDNNATFTLSVIFLGNSPESAVSFVVVKPNGCAVQGMYHGDFAKENMEKSIENLKSEVKNYFARLSRNE